ncbi:hypothetical protein ACX9NE_28185 [Mycobacterium sp. ML4]
MAARGWMGLRAGSGILTGHAQRVAAPGGGVSGSVESAGVAAAVMHAAFGEFCGAFGGRLSWASAALTVASGAFVAMDEAGAAALTVVAPGQAR